MGHTEQLLQFVQDKGFIFGPEPEIYGGLAGFYTYGPLGKLLKNNVEDTIRRVFTEYDFFEVECPTVMPAKVWEASGHLGGFTDPLVQCGKCKKEFRVDHLIAETHPKTSTAGWKAKDYSAFLKENKVGCTSCKAPLPSEIKNHTLMMRTTIGVDHEAYNRPETATTTYLPFHRYVRFFRDKLPFGVFQIGKAYRNEISPRQFVLRMREFTQAEGQLFIFEDQKESYDRYENVKDVKVPLWTEAHQKSGKEPEMVSLATAVKKKLLQTTSYATILHLAYRLFSEMGIPSDKMRLRQHHSDEKAFYASDAWDLEIQTRSFGWVECCGIHDRGTYDLTQHEKFSGVELKHQDQEHKKQTPHIIEIAFGTDRPTFALLDLFYSSLEENKERDLLSLPRHMVPIQVGVFPLVNKLNDKAREVHASLKEHNIMCVFDKSGSIGKRYARSDEIGMVYGVTVDFDTLEGKGVTVRDRDTTDQVRVPLDKLPLVLHALLGGELSFDKAGTKVVPVKEK